MFKSVKQVPVKAGTIEPAVYYYKYKWYLSAA